MGWGRRSVHAAIDRDGMGMGSPSSSTLSFSPPSPITLTRGTHSQKHCYNEYDTVSTQAVLKHCRLRPICSRRGNLGVTRRLINRAN